MRTFPLYVAPDDGSKTIATVALRPAARVIGALGPLTRNPGALLLKRVIRRFLELRLRTVSVIVLDEPDATLPNARLHGLQVSCCPLAGAGRARNKPRVRTKTALAAHCR